MKRELKKIKTSYRIELVILFCIVVACVLYGAFGRSLGGDEREHTYATFLIYRGMIPYRDFFEHHHPLMWYMCYPLVALFYDSAYIWYAIRSFALLLLVFDCFFIVKICQLISQNRFYSVLAVLFFMATEATALWGTDFRPDNLMIMFSLAGVYCWLSFVKYGWQSALNLAFLLFFLALMALQKMVVVLLPIAVVSFYLLYCGKITWRAVGKAMILPLFFYGVYIVYLYQTETLKDYYELNWLLNLKQSFAWRKTIFQTLYCIVALLGATGGVLFSQNRLFKIISAICLMIFCLLQFVFYAPWLQYWLPIYPFFALVVAYYVAQFRDALWGVVLLSCIAIGICNVAYKNYQYISGGVPLQHYVYLSRHVLAATEKNDVIIGNVWTVGGLRFDATGYYWFERSYTALLDYRLFHRREWPDVERIIKIRRPKLIANDVSKVCISDDNMLSFEHCVEEEFISDRKFLYENYYYQGAVYLRKY